MSNIKDNLNVNVEKQDGLVCKINIEFPKTVYNNEYDKIVNEVSKTTSVPGFRKGKVPSSVIKQKYANYIVDQLSSDLRNQALEEAIKKENLQVATVVELTDLDVQENIVSFTADVELHPSLDVTGYKGLTLNLVDSDKLDKEVDEWVKNYTKEKAEYKDLSETRSPKKGEWAKIDVLAYQVEGVTEKPTDQKDIYFYIPKDGENYYSDPVVNDELAKELLVMNIGDEKEFSVTYPSDHKEDFFKDKTVKGTLKYNSLATKVEPELTDDLVKNDKNIFAENIDGLKKYFAENIRSIRKRQQEQELVEAVKSALISDNVFDIPKSQINTEKEGLREQWGRLSDKELEQKAIENIKFRYIVSEIIAKENLNIKPEDLMAKLPKDNAKMKKEELNKLAMEIENNMLWTNFTDFIKSNATITYYDPMEKKDTNNTENSTTV